jgi:hypothetical protein
VYPLTLPKFLVKTVLLQTAESVLVSKPSHRPYIRISLLFITFGRRFLDA